ncbi:MAG: glycosyl hydrolase [Sulfurimonas sp.]|nr:MAG: glycosyl hydrolase [Sulfurimonas sp.]
MIKILLIINIFLISLLLNADVKDISEQELKKQIGRMLLVGFDNEKIDKNSKIVKLIQKYDLGGVILFDKFYENRSKTKNISSPAQVKDLTSKLKEYANKPLLISVDFEGGKVSRLKKIYGFDKFPSAKKISELSSKDSVNIYNSMSLMLYKNGFNCDFAPVVDLAIEPKNMVIYGLERSYGKNPEQVARYAKIFMDSLKKAKVLSVLKHFPGHGSSLADSHKGFVDITDTWSEKELEPYQILIDSGDVKMIMTAHVYNKHLDDKYPATLSYKINTKLLRQKMNYQGVIISDDLQMNAIRNHYTLKETVTLAINSGVDILLFGNQLANQNIDELVDIIYKQVQNEEIKYSRILESNKRINNVLRY